MLIQKDETMKSSEYKKVKPWINSYYHSKYRCTNPNNKDYKNYGAKGIKFNLSHEDINKIWHRDKASLMESPTIDRIENEGDYELSNCQFIENSINASKDKTNFKIAQCNKNKKVIKIWSSQYEISKKLGFDQAWISRCIRNKKLGYGFYWRNV